MLTTMLRPTAGLLKLDGHDVTRERDSARKSFGIVFQDPSLDEELTAYENLDLHSALYGIPKNKRRARIEELMTLVDLWDRHGSFVKTYSGGMRRRLEIARGLLHEPKVLFLDEPTLGLDTQTRNTMWAYVKRLSHEKGMTIFFTERIAIIDQGKIIARGTNAQLTEQTKTDSLEQAYLKLTGTGIREEQGNNDGLNAKMALRNRRLR
jgi:ABC-2 type transport system ATP-binding protein